MFSSSCGLKKWPQTQRVHKDGSRRLRFAVFLFCRASQCLPPADGQSTFPRRNLTKTYFTSELYSPSPPTTAWGLVFCTAQSEYLYKYFIFFGQIFNREFNKTEMAETNGNRFGSKHCWELRWEALERRLRASGVLITDRMDIIRRCNKPATCRSGKRVYSNDCFKETCWKN